MKRKKFWAIFGLDENNVIWEHIPHMILKTLSQRRKWTFLDILNLFLYHLCRLLRYSSRPPPRSASPYLSYTEKISNLTLYNLLNFLKSYRSIESSDTASLFPVLLYLLPSPLRNFLCSMLSKCWSKKIDDDEEFLSWNVDDEDWIKLNKMSLYYYSFFWSFFKRCDVISYLSVWYNCRLYSELNIHSVLNNKTVFPWLCWFVCTHSIIWFIAYCFFAI